ncbi:MAG: DMT family transporter [Pseudomonadota bacterium]
MIRYLYSQPWLLFGLTVLFWAGNAIASRVAVGEIEPFQLVLFRWVLVAIAMWVFFGHQVREHWQQIRPRLWWLTMIGGVGFTVFNAMFYLAGHSTTAVHIGIIQGAMPVMVLIGAFIAYRTPIKGVQVFGVAMALIGVLMVASHGNPANLVSTGLNPGDGMMLIAGAAYSFYTVMLRNRPDIPGTAFFTVMAFVAMATSLPFAIAEAMIQRPSFPTWNGWLITLYAAIFPSCLSQLFFLRGVDLVGPGRAGVYFNLVPVFVSILGILLLGEQFAWYHAAALVLVLGGIALTQRGTQ